MKTRASWITAFLVGLTATLPSAPLVPEGIGAELSAMVEARYSTYKEAAGLPDGAGVLVHLATPKGEFTAAAGLPPGADETWRYRIASVSKTFTAAAVMLLDQEGRLDIDDLITDSIPGTDLPYLANSPNYAIPHKDRITIRHLLSHRAGVFDVFNNPVPATSPFPYAGSYYNYYVYGELGESDHQFTADELAGVVAANGLSTGAPGEFYKYSDTGFTLLAKIVERVSGTSYDRFLEERFWKPFGLVRTSAPWNGNDTSIPAPFLEGHVVEGGESFRVVEDNMSSQVGPGNVISTAADLARWIRTILSWRGPLSRDQILRMSTVPTGNTSYALGLGNTAAGLGHSGAHPGYVNMVAYNPDDDVALVVATPFIDYSKLGEHLAFMIELGTAARTIAGYPGVWKQRTER